MWTLVTVGLCVLVTVSGLPLPDITVHHEDGALHFTMPHIHGLKEVLINYQLESKLKNVLPAVGKLIKEGEEWVLKVENLVLHPGDEVHYNAVAYGSHGKKTGPVHKWIYNPVPTLTPRRIRAVTFRDDFNGGQLDRAHWDIEVSMFGGFNWEFQVYTPEARNIFVRGGNLYLKPTFTTDDPRWDEHYLHTGVMDIQKIWGVCTQSGNYGCHREGANGLLPPIMSGKIMSKPTLRYGHVEVRARVPKGDWIWPAIWMMPRSSHYGGWPRSGEIDIMETRGNARASCGGIDQISSTLHWGTSAGDNHYGQTTHTKAGSDWSAAFHTWRLDWSHDHIITSVDNQEILRVVPPAGGFSALGHINNIWAGGDKMAPFDQDFYMIFNVAVGGTNGFFPDNCQYDTAKPWANTSPHAAQDFWDKRSQWQGTWHGDMPAMEIDYVQFST